MGEKKPPGRAVMSGCGYVWRQIVRFSLRRNQCAGVLASFFSLRHSRTSTSVLKR